MRSYVSVPDDSEPMANPLAGLTFELDGEVFRCDGEPDLLDQSELALLAASATDIRRPEAQAAIAAFLQMALGPQEYSRFKMHTKSSHTRPEVIMAIMAGINEELEAVIVEGTGRPTVPLSPSLAGDAERAGQLRKVISLGTGDVTVVGEDGQPTVRPGRSGTPRKARSGSTAGRTRAASSRSKAASSSGT